jgi:hypothetical protein
MAEAHGKYERGYSCEEIVELTADYVDQAMPEDEATLFEEHLDFCDGCVWFVEQVRISAQLAGKAGLEELPDELQSKLIQAFRDWKATP